METFIFRINHLRPDHQDIIISMGNLAQVLTELNRLS
jgi:hypothetical protein